MEWLKRLFNIDPQWRVLGYGPSKSYNYEKTHTISARVYVVESKYGNREFKVEVLNVSKGCSSPDLVDRRKIVELETTSFKRAKLREWSIAKFNKVFKTTLNEYKDSTSLETFLESNLGKE